MHERTRAQRRAVSGLVAAALVAGGCTGGDDTTTETTAVATTTTTVPPRADDGVLSIGIFLPTTGPGATLGTPMIEAAVGAIEAINDAGGVLGRDVEFETIDESSETGLDDLLASDIDAIVGPASSLVALSQLETAVGSNDGVVVCSPSTTAIALDDYPDRGYFFRTAPSDSLQMTALARQTERTGARSVTIGYLDDPYGRDLLESFRSDVIGDNRLELLGEVGFSGDDDDLSDVARELLEADPGAIVLLADADTGGRLLLALDEASNDAIPPQVVLNDSIRSARQVIATVSPALRQRLVGVAPLAMPTDADDALGPFAAHTADCVDLIALAVVQSGSDAPSAFRRSIASVSSGGRVCTSFEDCAERIDQGLQIDFEGRSGPLDLSTATGNVQQALFEVFGFDTDGNEANVRRIAIS